MGPFLALECFHIDFIFVAKVFLQELQYDLLVKLFVAS